jgi:hypothetical protein
LQHLAVGSGHRAELAVGLGGPTATADLPGVARADGSIPRGLSQINRLNWVKADFLHIGDDRSVVYVVLGCVMDSLAMILLTIPCLPGGEMGLDFWASVTEKSIWFRISPDNGEIGPFTRPGMNNHIANRLPRAP